MPPLWHTVIGICLLRSGPQDLPYSPTLTRNLVLLAFAVDLIYAWVLDVAQAWPRLLLSLVFALGLPWLLLQWRQRQPRYAQTVAALMASGLLFTLLFLPVALWAQQQGAPVEGETLQPGQAAAGWLVLLLLGWKLAVNGHILRHALDAPRWAGALLAIGWFLLEFSLDRALFGGLQ